MNYLCRRVFGGKQLSDLGWSFPAEKNPLGLLLPMRAQSPPLPTRSADGFAPLTLWRLRWNSLSILYFVTGKTRPLISSSLGLQEFLDHFHSPLVEWEIRGWSETLLVSRPPHHVAIFLSPPSKFHCGRTYLWVDTLKFSYKIEPQFLLVLNPATSWGTLAYLLPPFEESLGGGRIHISCTFLSFLRTQHQDFSTAPLLTFWAA